MENEALNNLPPFYVGQKVVYIGTKRRLKGTHTILSIHKGCCKCIDFEVEIETKNNIDIHGATLVQCNECGTIIPAEKYRTYTFCSSVFRPLQESVFPSLTMSRVIEKEKELISMN